MQVFLHDMEKRVLACIKEEYLKEFSTSFLIPQSVYQIKELNETQVNNLLWGLWVRGYFEFNTQDKKLSLKGHYLTLTEKALIYFNA